MKRSFNPAEINLFAEGPSSSASPTQHAFRIAILSNLGGHSTRKQTTPQVANRKAVEIDRDNFDAVLAGLRVSTSLLQDAKSQHELQFSELDDFHPDRIFERMTMFAKLRALRAKVADPDTFPAVAEELGLLTAKSAPARSEAAKEAAPPVASVLSNGATSSLLDRAVEQTEDLTIGTTRPSRAASELDRFVRRVMKPHLVAAADPCQAETLAMLDRALSAQMRALLHVPAFQSIESAWRAIYFLVRRIQTGPQLKLYLFDISKDELVADLSGTPDLRTTGIYRLLVEEGVETPGAEPWAVIVGNYEFGAARKDAELLGKFGKVAKAAGAPFLAGASPQLVGCTSLADTPHPPEWRSPPDMESAAAWSALRALPEAAWIGLALPRLLLRLPYGKKTNPIESFDFEEMTQPPEHEDYLWGNPAFPWALLLAKSFGEDGWNMRPGTHSQIDGLPLYVYEHDGESELQPCAEALLTEEAAEQIRQHGLMPLASLKGKDAVRLVGFQSIALPLRALAGRWPQ